MRQKLPGSRWLSIRVEDDGRDEVGDFLDFVFASGCDQIAGHGLGDRDRDASDADFGEEELDEPVAEARALRSGERAAAPRPAVTRPDSERIRRIALPQDAYGVRNAPGTGGDSRGRGDDDPRNACAGRSVQQSRDPS